jgi:hypothetical protein
MFLIYLVRKRPSFIFLSLIEKVKSYYFFNYKRKNKIRILSLAQSLAHRLAPALLILIFIIKIRKARGSLAHEKETLAFLIIKIRIKSAGGGGAGLRILIEQ